MDPIEVSNGDSEHADKAAELRAEEQLEQPALPPVDSDKEIYNQLRQIIEFRYAKSLARAEHYLDLGYEPVECSFGSASIVGPMVLDHHGDYEEEEPVSLKAARLAMEEDFEPVTKFVVTGLADADATYAMLVLSGAIKPDLEIARALAELDIDPIGIDKVTEPYIRAILFDLDASHSLTHHGYRESLVSGFKHFDPTPLDPEEIKRAEAFELERIEQARAAIQSIGKESVFVISDAPARDIWHQYGSVVVQYKPEQKVITVSGLTPRSAQILGRDDVYKLFGEDGLKRLMPQMDAVFGEGSGGRNDIIGSPRGQLVDIDQAKAIYNKIREAVELRTRP